MMHVGRMGPQMPRVILFVWGGGGGGGVKFVGSLTPPPQLGGKIEK